MKKIVLLLLVLTVARACQPAEAPERKQLREEIQALEAQLLKAQDANKDRAAALALIEKAQQFADKYPADTLGAELLFKAADVAKGLGDKQKAIALWGRVQKDYPSYSKAPMALFLQGFVSDSELRDVVSATRYYRDFIVKYPNHPLADQALKLVKVITRSPEELVKEFETQQGSGVAE